MPHPEQLAYSLVLKSESRMITASVECGGDRADALGQRADKKIARRVEVTGESVDPLSIRRGNFLGMDQRHRVDAICSLIMNSMRASPTPAFGIIALRNARSGLPRFT